MKLTDLTYEQLEAAYLELRYSRKLSLDLASDLLEPAYFERADLLGPVIDCLDAALREVL